MTKKNFKIRGIAAGLALAASITLMPDAFGAIEGRWIHHPGANLRTKQESKASQVDRIIDGNRYVYFSVRGNLFNRSKPYAYTSLGVGYNTSGKFDPIQIFRYDKTKPLTPGNIRGLAQDMEPSGVLPVAMNYSYKDGVFAVAYDNNSVDFIYDDGTVVTSTVLGESPVGGASASVLSISFDSELPRAYLAGPFGFIAVDIKNGSAVQSASFGTPLAFATRVGDNMVVAAGTATEKSYNTATYIFPANNIPKTLAAPANGGDNLKEFMPVGPDKFVAIAPGTDDTNFKVNLYTISGSTLQSKTLVEKAEVDADAAGKDMRHLFNTDGFVLPAKNGYAVYCKDYIHFIRKNMDDADILSSVSKQALASDAERSAKSASADGSTVWFYTYETDGLDGSPRGFYTRSRANGQWGEPTDPVGPNAPTTAYPYYGKWSPKYGMMMRGVATSYDTGASEQDTFCAYKDGVWTDYSYSATNPAFYARGQYAKGIEIDPLNEDVVWAPGATYNGMIRMDLAHPDDFLALGSDRYPDYPIGFPGYMPLFPYQPRFTALINFTNVDFDNDNIMWFARARIADSNYYDYEDITNGYVPIYYLTPAERANISRYKTAEDAKSLKYLLDRELRVYRCYLSSNPSLIACKAPQNKNILLVSQGLSLADNRISFIYNHAGTPDKQDDDTMVFVNELYDENGEKVQYLREKGMYEDLTTGDVWWFTDCGPLIFKPTELLAGNKTVRRFRLTKNQGVEGDVNPFEQIQLTGVDHDLTGRKWISSEEGLYCLSNDGSEILAHFTRENSPLPSDHVWSVTCDGSTGALFVATDRGMVEFQPEYGGGTEITGEHLNIWPATLTPSYKGYVNIYGAAEGREYVVCDSKGSTVRTLGTPNAGLIQWDGRDDTGKKVVAGKYNVKRKNQDETHIITVLPE